MHIGIGTEKQRHKGQGAEQGHRYMPADHPAHQQQHTAGQKGEIDLGPTDRAERPEQWIGGQFAGRQPTDIELVIVQRRGAGQAIEHQAGVAKDHHQTGHKGTGLFDIGPAGGHQDRQRDQQ